MGDEPQQMPSDKVMAIAAGFRTSGPKQIAQNWYLTKLSVSDREEDNIQRGKIQKSTETAYPPEEAGVEVTSPTAAANTLFKACLNDCGEKRLHRSVTGTSRALGAGFSFGYVSWRAAACSGR